MTRQRFYPYATLPLGALRVDTEDPSVEMDSATGYLRLWKEPAPGWKISATVSVPEDAAERVLPESDRRDGVPLQLILTLRSATSHLRDSFREDFAAGEVTFDVDIARERYSGFVDMQVHLVRTRETEYSGAYAAGAWMVVGSSDVVRIDVDEPARPPGDALEIMWSNFTESTDPWLKEHDSNLFAVRTSPGGGPPTVHLNSAVEGAVAVLSSTGTTGRKARARDAIFNMVAHQTWSSILASALGELKDLTISAETTLDEAMQTLDGWMAAVVRDWAPWLFTDADRDEALTELWEQVKTGQWEDVLTDRLPNAIQSRFETHRGLTGFVKEFDL